MRVFLAIVIVTALAVAGYWVFSRETTQAELSEIEAIPVEPSPPSVEIEIGKTLIARLITEDVDIQAALEGETEKIVRETDDSSDDLYGPKTNEEILFDMMAPWFYMGFRSVINNEKQGQFKNTNTQRKSGWLSVGGTLEGAEIIYLDPDKAIVRFADATQEFLYVPEYPEPLDPTVPRTPEQIKAAQRRYAEVYMKKFIKQGREYDRLRGKKSFEIPSRKEQTQAGLEYLEFAREFAEKAASTSPPPEALIDPSELTPEQREAHRRYTEMFERQPEDVLERIETERQALEEELVGESVGTAPQPQE